MHVCPNGFDLIVFLKDDQKNVREKQTISFEKEEKKKGKGKDPQPGQAHKTSQRTWFLNCTALDASSTSIFSSESVLSLLLSNDSLLLLLPYELWRMGLLVVVPLPDLASVEAQHQTSPNAANLLPNVSLSWCKRTMYTTVSSMARTSLPTHRNRGSSLL
jgi:hypothetical protein